MYKHSVESAFSGRMVDYIITTNEFNIGMRECMEVTRQSIKEFLEITARKKVYISAHVLLRHTISKQNIKTRLESNVEEFAEEDFENFYSRAVEKIEEKLDKCVRGCTLHVIDKIVVKCLSLV